MTAGVRRAYASYVNMVHQCRSRNRYSTFGIWWVRRWGKFEAFLEDMGPRPKGTVLTRINPRLHYSRENCVYASRKEAHANRRWNREIRFMGETLSVAQWGRELKLNPNTIITRLNRGWKVEKALLEGASV